MLDEKRIKELQKMTKKELIEIIDKLEGDIYYYKNYTNALEKRIEKTEEDKEFYYKEMVSYREERAELADKLFNREEREEIKRKKEQLQKHNERGAGRKNKFNTEQIQQIKEARAEGKSIRAIAQEFNCSVGLIHKLINEK